MPLIVFSVVSRRNCFEAMVAEATRTFDQAIARAARPLLGGCHLQKAGFFGKGHLSARNLNLVSG